MDNFKIPFSKAFGAYALKNGIGEDSYKSYLSYLKSLDTNFFRPTSITNGPSPFTILTGEYLLNTPLKNIIESLYKWKALLDKEINSPKTVKHAQNTIRNWMSAYTLYINFINNYFELS